MINSEKTKPGLNAVFPQVTRIVLLSLLTVLAGCHWFHRHGPEYLDSKEGKPLKIPPGMSAPKSNNPMLISVGPMRMPTGDELKPAPPRVVSTAGGHDSNTHMAWSAEGAYLFVKDTPASVARRLGYAIKRSGMKLLEKDDNGAYKFQYQQQHVDKEGFFHRIMFWRDGPRDYSGTYRLALKQDGKNTRVYLYETDGSSADTETSEHILGIFMERLG